MKNQLLIKFFEQCLKTQSTQAQYAIQPLRAKGKTKKDYCTA